MEPYFPSSNFLQSAIADEVPFEGPFGTANLARLIALTADPDEANRDWATFLLALEEADTPEVREALLKAAGDESHIVRAEAIWGLAKRDRAVALPLLKRELAGENAWVPLLEAAEIVADPSLADLLLPFTEPSGDKFLDEKAVAAFHACKARL